MTLNLSEILTFKSLTSISVHLSMSLLHGPLIVVQQQVELWKIISCGCWHYFRFLHRFLTFGCFVFLLPYQRFKTYSELFLNSFCRI